MLKLRVSAQDLEDHGACKEGIAWFRRHFKRAPLLRNAVLRAVDQGQYDYATWALEVIGDFNVAGYLDKNYSKQYLFNMSKETRQHVYEDILAMIAIDDPEHYEFVRWCNRRDNR